MKVLFLLDNSPISPNHRGGASALYDMYLRALHQSGIEIHVFRSLNGVAGEEVKAFEAIVDHVYQKQLRNTASWIDFDYERLSPPHNKQRYMWIPQALMNPLRYTFGIYDQVENALRETIDFLKPDLIWANHMMMGGVTALINPSQPWIYSHLDWRYRIKAVRAQHRSDDPLSLRARLFNWVECQAEFAIARRATVAISGSITETDDLRRLGTNALYIPVCYDVDIDSLSHIPKSDIPRIVHFGGMRTTANRIGLERYLDVVHPILIQDLGVTPELWIVGEMDGAEERLVEKLRKVGAICTGYVADLSTVFRPYDIAIVPYEHNTGTRTRVPLLLAYHQVIVAVKASVMGFPELVDGQSAILVDTLEQMRTVLVTLIRQTDRRISLGTAAGRCFREHFVLQAQMPKFNKLLSIAQSR